MPEYIEYQGARIPLSKGNRVPRDLYNLPDDEIDDFAAGTWFDGDGTVFEPGSFGSGVPYGDRLPVLGIEECKDRTEWAEAHNATLFDVAKRHKIPCKNQGSRPFCWGYGACTAYELNYAARYDRYVELSPDLTCAEATGGRSRGGWANEFLKVAEKRGIAPQSMVQRQTLRYRDYDTPEINAERQKYKPTEWVDYRRGDSAALRSACVSNIASGIGLMVWGHLMAVAGWTYNEKHGELWLIRNSHSSRFGNDGWYFTDNAGMSSNGGGSAVLVA